MITPTAREDDDDKKLGFAPDVGVEERIGGDDAVVHEQAMPEGPTVTRWEEWAYVSPLYELLCFGDDTWCSTCITTETLASDQITTLVLSSR